MFIILDCLLRTKHSNKTKHLVYNTVDNGYKLVDKMTSVMWNCIAF